MKSGELKWVRIEEELNLILKVKSLEPATFTDDDFKLTGCNPKAMTISSTEERLPHEQQLGRNVLHRLAIEAKNAAKQARRAARKAEAASKKIDEALK
jgi:hypothetical protein